MNHLPCGVNEPALDGLIVAVSPLSGYDGSVPRYTGRTPLRSIPAVIVGAPLEIVQRLVGFFTDHLDKNKEGVCKIFFSFLRSQWFLESKNFAAHAPCARSEIRRFLKLEFWRKIYLIGSIVPVFENSNNYNITPP